ncbi:MAG: hypothetical protein IJR14_08780 [Synergistaceae bacterium]|nr:hypothetical protein [Synergistaceae bacterium]
MSVPLEEGETEIEFFGCLYIVFGRCEEDPIHELDGVIFAKNEDCHPSTGIEDVKEGEGYFVLGFGPIYLPKVEKYFV